MKIYEDPPQPGGTTASVWFHSPPKSSRKAVSFAGNINRAGIKTPLRNANRQSPGRTPKIPKSSQMTVGSFRQSLKTPPPPPQNSRGKSSSGELVDKENTINRREGSEAKSLNAKTALFHNLVKQTGASSNATVTTTNPKTPTSASALRRTLRATVQTDGSQNKLAAIPNEAVTKVVSDSQAGTRKSLLNGHRLGGGGNRVVKSNVPRLGPPQRVAPKTPNSLLRTEMEVLDSSNSFGTDNDDSLLLSPPPGAVWNALNLSSDDNVTSTTGLVVVSPQAAATLHSWSSERKRQPNNDSQRYSEVGTSENLSLDIVSPTLPRTLTLQTPPSDTAQAPIERVGKSGLVELTSNDGAECNVAKSSKGGIAMDLTNMFSPDRRIEKTPQEKQPRHRVAPPSSPPLSASLPSELLLRLQANRQTGTKKEIKQHLPRATESTTSNGKRLVKGASVKSSTCRKDRENIANDARSKMKRSRVSQRDPPVSSIQSEPLSDRSSRFPDKVHDFETSPRCVEEKSIMPSDDNSHKGGMAFEIKFQNESVLNTTQPPKSKKPDLSISTYSNASLTWADKQSESFTGWLNYTFNPEEEGHSDGSCSTSGLRGLLIHRRLAGIRSKAKDLFHGETMRNSRMILLREISGARLAIRKDRDVTADIQLRRQLTDLLLSYTTPWLRMGLEVMFDEIIEPAPATPNGPQTYLGRMRVALESFIKLRFLSDDSTLAKFTKGRCNVPSGVFETRYKAQMRCLVLSRIMILVFFLDLAKSENILDKVPRLFSVSSEVKSSRDVLIAICRACLSAEGDIVKHLSRIGLNVAYKQDPVDEVNFKVSNMATDLRDGVLLTRLSEIITDSPFKSTMKSLRLPSVSRLQKKHNVSLALSKFQECGIMISDAINAHHIMDAHREMVLALMWCIISYCCVTRLLNVDTVEQEIQDVLRSSQARSKVSRRHILLPTKDISPPVRRQSLESTESNPEQVLKRLLLRWSRAVCASFGLHIEDFSNSFADGRALCCLIHYYHPGLLPLNDINIIKVEDSSRNTLLENERSNWLKAIKAIKELGGIPAMLPCSDTQSPPDEQSILMCLSYLCSRLMESSKEIFATILIQAHYRKYQRRVLFERKMISAKNIFSFWIAHRQNYYRAQRCRYAKAVAKLEYFVVRHKAALHKMRHARLEKERQIFATIQIQRVFRGLLGRARCHFVWEQLHAAILLQSVFRRFLATRIVNHERLRHDRIVALQSFIRGWTDRRTYHRSKCLVINLQRLARGLLARKRILAMDIAASKLQLAWWSYVSRQDQEFASQLIQKMWRGVLDRQKYDCLRQEYLAACLIQRTWRGYSQQITFLILVESTLLLQRVTRGFLSRKETSLQRSQSAAIFIQKLWRGFSQQVKYQIDIMDVICVQCLARRRLAQTLRNKMLRAALVLQCATRCAVARRKLAAAQSAMKIQTFWRSVKIQTRYRSMRQASMQIQRIWRGHSLRGEIWRQVFAATIIQSNWRCYWVLSDFEQYKVEKSATVLLQALVRRAIARRAFLECIFSATTIQRRWRRCLESTRYNAAATALQKAWRRYIQRVEFMSLRSSAIVIQCCFRVAQALEAAEFKRREKAATSLQRIWRGFFQQVQFQLEMMDIVCVQSQVRKYLARRRFLVIYHSTLRIQRCCRCAAARKHLALRRMERNTLLICSAITIQAILRSNALRLTYTTKRRASIAVQRFWRGYVIRCAMWNLTFAACQIQRNWRRYISRCSYLLQLLDIRSAILIQSVVRMHQTQVLLIRQKEASVKLQCLVRRRRSQRHLSMLIDMRRVLELRVKSALVIQTLVRGFMCRLQMARKADAATVIQSCWRCYEAQNNYLLDLLENKAAVVIQATFRMYLQRDDFMVTKYAAHTIQRCTRGLLARIDVAMKHFAATEIQRIWRGHSTYTLESIMNAVVKIQSMIRMAWAQRRFDELRILYWADLCFRQRKARQIQSAFREFQQRKRMHVAAEVIQSRFRFYSQLKRIQLLSIGMTMFQSLFRGWKARKMRNKKIARAAQRIREENNRAIHNPDLRLGNRTDRALYILQTSQSLTKIMDAVKELEASTRLSVVCCQVFTKANAANILLHLIQSCNRSVPHMELKEHILLTLENVSRYPSLVGSFAHYKYAEVFLDNIQVFRDKDGIFCLAISLLDRISSANPHVAQYCSSHEHLKRLREVFRVVSRRLDPRKVSGVSDQRPSEDVLKKRVCFNRDYSIKLLGQMIDSFSNLEDLQIPERNRRSRFEF